MFWHQVKAFPKPPKAQGEKDMKKQKDANVFCTDYHILEVVNLLLGIP